MTTHAGTASPSIARKRIAGRLTRTVFAAVAFSMIGFYAAIIGAPIVAVALTGTETWSGLPITTAILGTAGGAAILSTIMARRGRRPGLALGWSLAALGAALAIVAIARGSFVAFLGAMLVLGCGQSASQLARYAAADPHPPARRGRMLSLVVLASAVGAVVGPMLLEPAGRMAAQAGLPELAGGPVAGVGGFLVAAVVCQALLRPDPASLATQAFEAAPASPPMTAAAGRSVGTAEAPPPGAPIAADAPFAAGVAPPVEATSTLAPEAAPRVGTTTSATAGDKPRWERRTLVAVGALVAAQFVMLLIMTTTPVHISHHGHGLGAVGFVMSAHLLGMFGLAPVVGWLGDRIGGLTVAFAGLVLVGLSGAAGALAPPQSVGMLTVALFLLGLGWCAAFVASSTLLASADARMQGRADALAWACAAVASFSSGVLIASVGFVVLCLIGIAIALAAALAVLRLLIPRAAAGATGATGG